MDVGAQEGEEGIQARRWHKTEQNRGCPHNGGGVRYQNPSEGRRHPRGGRGSSVGWSPSQGRRTSMWETA